MGEFDDLILAVRGCTLCGLAEKRTQAVPGEGARDADIVFIGEGPGFYEDRDGLPFVGPAGRLLDELLASIGLHRDDVYITNMVKCRPPNNRDPFPGELRSCQPYLEKQLEMIAPRVIVTLGRYSFAHFFPRESISKARGKPRTWKGATIYPMYHPAAALHNPSLRDVILSDFKSLPSLIEKSRQPVEDKESAETRQLSLF